jgi:hypothetical protein
MKKAIKNWLFKEEIAEIQKIRESISNTKNDIEDSLKEFPTHDLMSDYVHGVIDDGNYVTDSDIRDQLEDVVYENDLRYQLECNDVVFSDNCEFITSDDLQEYGFITENKLENHLSDAIDAMEWSEIIGEQVNRVFNARAEEVVKQVLKDIPGYFMYEQIKRYIEEDYVSFAHFSLNFDDLASTVMLLEDKIETVENSDQVVDDKVFLTKLKLALHTLIVDHNEQSEDYEK